MIPEPRTHDERSTVEAAMRRFREDWGVADTFTFRDLLQIWVKLVESLEREQEYEFAFSDYVHDLQQRDAIEAMQQSLPPRLADDVKAFLQPLDERFRFATNEVDEPLLDASVCHSFWWRRVPKRVGAEFVEEVTSRNG